MKQVYSLISYPSEAEVFTWEMNKNRSFYKRTYYFYASKRIFWSKMNVMKVIHCEYLQVNIPLYAYICKQIFAWKWNLLKVLWLFVSKRIFWSKYFASMRTFEANIYSEAVLASHVLCSASNRLFVCKFVRIFWSKYETNDANKWCLRIFQNMWIWSK